MRNCFDELFVVFFSLAILLSFSNSFAQKGSALSYAAADNGVIKVLVERSSGQFRIEAAGGAPLLFRGEKGVTAFTNLHLFDNTWTTNKLHRPAPPYGTLPFPQLQIEELSDRVRLSGIVRKGSDSVRFVQDLIPSLDGDYAYVNIATSVENLSIHALSVGSILMLDIMIGNADTVDLTADAQRITHERDWRDAAVPDEYQAVAAGSPYHIRGRLRSSTADIPDRFIAGTWQFNGYLGTIAWDYTPSGLPITDDAVVLRWDDALVVPGETRTTRTDYGYMAFTEISLSCGIDAVGYNRDSTAYAPDPISLHATVSNTGVLPISSIDIAVTLPPELSLAAGESVVKTVAGPLPIGGSSVVTWLAHPAVVAVPTLVQATFDIIAPAELAASCQAEVEIPPLLKPMAALDCGDTIRLAQDPNGGGYAPDPFLASVQVKNTGLVPLHSAVVTIALPAELVLVSPALTQAVLPDPLLPGQTAQIDWQLRGIVQDVPTTVVYSVSMNSLDGISLSCENAVILPPINREPCIEPGISTAGTDFYLAFLPDVVGAADEFLRVFITAPQQSHVRIQRLGSGVETVIDVPAGALRMVQLEETLNDYSVETPVLRGVRVLSDNPVHVFTGNYRDRHSDGTVVLPVHALGTQYVTAGYNWGEAYEHFIVLATEDGTDVTITPHAFTSTAKPDGVPFTITLARGELYYVKSFIAGSGGSLTGTRIAATKPVAVFSGAESGWIPEVNSDNYGYLNPSAEQMMPFRFLGKEYIAVPFRSRRNGDTYRIIATEDNTTVTLNGLGMPALTHAGDWVEGILTDVTHIGADKPIMVAQYANSARWDADDNEYGDASMLLLVPTDRYMSCHYFPAGMLVADPSLLPNQAVYIDPGNWLQVRDTPQLASPVFTAECWIRPWDSGTIISRAGTSGEYWRLDFDRGRRRYAIVTGTMPQSQVDYSRDNIANPGVWTHVALVMNGNAGTVRLYIDGALEMDIAIPQMSFPVNGGLSFGGIYNDVNAATYSGLIEECRYWATERTQQEIQAAMNARLSAFDRNGLLGYWSFCESFTDETRYSNHFLPMGVPSLIPVYDLPAGLNCIEQEDSNFVNIVVPNGGQGQVLLNFASLDPSAFTQLAGTQWYSASVKVPTGINRLETTDIRGLGATTYGFAYHDAYTMSTGFRTSSNTSGSLPPPLPGELSLDAPWPQPVHGEATVSFKIPQASDVELYLSDVLGRIRRQIASGPRAAGRYSIVLSADGLPPGRYQLFLRASGRLLTRPVVIVR
ncbi:MAG: LamG-like jellyroll fold domain-containing protein [Bacteroidota bacterium]